MCVEGAMGHAHRGYVGTTWGVWGCHTPQMTVGGGGGGVKGNTSNDYWGGGGGGGGGGYVISLLVCLLLLCSYVYVYRCIINLS